MNALTYALSVVKTKIPIEILNIAFRENSNAVNNIITIDELISNKILRPRVLTDCNLVGGVHTTIDLNQCVITKLPDVGNYIIYVPKVLTGNRSIINALSLVSTVTTTLNMPSVPTSGNTSGMLDKLADTMTGSGGVLQTSRLEVIGENTIYCATNMLTFSNGVLRCTIENNANMSNLNTRSYPVFSDLVVYAIKAYIYNMMRVKINQGYLYGGHELSVITEIIDSYSDAETMYDELLRGKWAKVQYMNNESSMTRHIRTMIGYNI